jgi:hypothetical protein
MSILTNGKCSQNCDPTPPIFSFDSCPEVNRGQIDRIYLYSVDGADFSNAEQLAEWTTRLSNTNQSDPDKIRFLTVMGEKPNASGDVLEISDRRKVILDKTHTLNFDVDETNDTNYEAMRWIECNPNFKFYYGVGKYLYGSDESKNEGILGFFQINDNIPKERKQLNVFNGVITWEAPKHPTRFLNPMA